MMNSGSDNSDRTQTTEAGAALNEVCKEDSSEVSVGILVSHYIDPDNSIAEIQGSVEGFFRTIPPGLSDESLLAWFREQGFGSNAPKDVTAQDSNLMQVLAAKQGIPISQAVLLIGAARACGLTCYGINFPGHFLVRLQDQVVDPLRFEVVATDQLKSRIDLSSRATGRMIALRMFNNLKALRLRETDIAGALDIVDVQMAIAEDIESRSSLLFERGEYWLRLGAGSVAREAFEACAEICPHPELAERARQQAEAVDTSGQTFH